MNLFEMKTIEEREAKEKMKNTDAIPVAWIDAKIRECYDIAHERNEQEMNQYGKYLEQLLIDWCDWNDCD